MFGGTRLRFKQTFSVKVANIERMNSYQQTRLRVLWISNPVGKAWLVILYVGRSANPQLSETAKQSMYRTELKQQPVVRRRERFYLYRTLRCSGSCIRSESILRNWALLSIVHSCDSGERSRKQNTTDSAVRARQFLVAKLGHMRRNPIANYFTSSCFKRTKTWPCYSRNT